MRRRKTLRGSRRAGNRLPGNVSRYEFLGTGVLRTLRMNDGYPELTAGFESSVPGLHFVGAPAARSFGSLCRFVSGTPFTARALTHCVLGTNGQQAELFLDGTRKDTYWPRDTTFPTW
jgi:hypothetical protein